MLGNIIKFATNVFGGPAGQILPFVPGLLFLSPLTKMATFLKEVQKATGISNPLMAAKEFFFNPKYAQDATIIQEKLGKSREGIMSTIEWAQKNNIPFSNTFENIEKLRAADNNRPR
jgi:hypothetical protein